MHPNYFSVTENVAKTYYDSSNVDGFFITAVPRRPFRLANIATFEIFSLIYKSGKWAGRETGPMKTIADDPRFKGDQIGAQRWIPLEVAKHLDPDIVGIWDNNGSDILISNIEENLAFKVKPSPPRSSSRHNR